MLLSMTGIGQATLANDQLRATAEIRAVNNRFLKISTRMSERYNVFEPRIEKLVRESVQRGTLTISLKTELVAQTKAAKLNATVIAGYWKQLEAIHNELHISDSTSLASILQLPHVLDDDSGEHLDEVETDWPLLESVLRQAINTFNDFRANEGRRMYEDIETNRAAIVGQLGQVRELAPQVVHEYRDRILERVNNLLAETDASIDAKDLIREVSLFADRSDINEEIKRLDSHLEQMTNFMTNERSPGRKLDFLSQEMLREVNTIGSKANHVQIAHAVVEMKSAVERIREMVQNVE